ncbi:hypothetical protein [Campylobacter concisus]|jgi:lipoprotein
MKNYFILFVFVTIFLYGCSDDIVPIEVRQGADTLESGSIMAGNYNTEIVNTIVVSALVDSVKINSIKINKGNCKTQNFKPKTLKFGEEISYITNCDRLLKAAVNTDQGEWEFNW